MLYTPVINDSKHYGNNRYFVESPKLHREVRLCSSLEYDHWILEIEMNPDVISACEQPCIDVQVKIGDELVTSIPDVFFALRNGIEGLKQIKYSNELDPNHKKYNPRSILQVQAQQHWCRMNNKVHELRTELEVRQNPLLLYNMHKLFHYLILPSRNADLNSNVILEWLEPTPVTFNDLLNAFPTLSANEMIESVARLKVTGKIQGNFGECILGRNIKVWRCENGKNIEK
jgi:hypothetical protein